MDNDTEKDLRDAMERHGYDEFEARLYLLGALALNTDMVRQVLREVVAHEREACEGIADSVMEECISARSMSTESRARLDTAREIRNKIRARGK